MQRKYLKYIILGCFQVGLLLTQSAVFAWQTVPDSLKTKAKLSGQWRTYYMSTHNEGDLQNFYALATGGKIKYEQPVFKNFSLGSALYTSFNLGLQDLTVPDAITGRISRYEAGLFDGTDLSRRAIFILGELYAAYETKKHFVKVGRMLAKTPFLNGQDGRMIPTLEQGIWYSFKPSKKYIFEGAIFNEISPRSTGEFFNIGETLGTYPIGRNPDGKPSGYGDNNTQSSYLALLHTKLQTSQNLTVHIWDYHADNLFNMLYINPELKLDDNGTNLGLQWVMQNRVGDGGNAVDSLRYFTDQQSHVLGARFQFKVKKATLSVAYTHILDKGRFLFPREWGREFLYSFQKRERSEGSANNHALVLYYNNAWQIGKGKINGIFSVGHHWKPPVTDAAANKYAQPDYTHINLDFFYHSEKFKRLKPELLLTYKRASGDFPENPNFIFNKVNLFITNFIINYNF